MIGGADPEKKGCDDEWQTKMIQVLDEGRYKELDGFVDQWFLQMEKMDSRQIREYCYKSLRKAVMYFHMDTPPLFKIYQLSDQDQEKFSKILKEDMQMLASCLKDNSESFTILISSKAKNYIDVNYSKKDLSLREIADKLNVSYGYLSTAFTKTYGENFKSYLVSVRMEKAREFLMERKYKIYEIADKTGYTSSRYFTDAFKKRFGISPGDYILRLNGESEV